MHLKMRLLILLGLVYGSIAVSRPQKNNYKPGGELSDIERYPFMSSMQIGVTENTLNHFGGGVLLTSQTVLTEAYSFDGFSLASFYWRVRLGSEYWNNGGSIHFISEVIIHEDFDRNIMENDVAIVRLTVPAIFSDKIGVARISGNNYNVADGALVDIVGWATEGNPFSRDQEHLKEKLGVSVINNELCAARWFDLNIEPGFPRYWNVTDSMLCTGVYDDDNEIRNPCVATPGSPVLQYGDVVVGVYSWDFDCGYSVYPAVSAKVSLVSDWIVAKGSTRTDKILVV